VAAHLARQAPRRLTRPGVGVSAITLFSMIGSWVALIAAFWCMHLANLRRRIYDGLINDLREQGKVVVVCPYVLYGENDLAHCTLIENL
jgi:hypothetical protein